MGLMNHLSRHTVDDQTIVSNTRQHIRCGANERKKESNSAFG